MLDFNSFHSIALQLLPEAEVSAKLNMLIDNSIESGSTSSQERHYLGASVVGHVCERHVQYHMLAGLGLVERAIPEPRVMRIFDRGNTYEEKARDWLKGAGFLFGRTRKGKSFQDFDGHFKGHVDGVITGWKKPGIECPIILPALWENKCLGSKSWKKLADSALYAYSSTYYAQVQLYMYYLGLERCLFTAVNADTMDLYHEVVQFNDRDAETYRSRVQHVIQACDMGEMVPRHTQDKNHYICKWCNFSAGCWL